MTTQRPVISLFSGAGGLDLAVEKCAEPPLIQDGTPGPYRVAVATDYNQTALDSLSKNFPDVPTLMGDIRTVPTEELLAAAGIQEGEAALVVGGPPCTPFSKSGFWIKEKRESRDPNASLLDEYVRVVKEARPEAFVLENVQGLTYSTHKAQLERLLSAMREEGYNPHYKVLLAAEYGVPQLRRRVFIVGRRDGQAFNFPSETHTGVSERDRRVLRDHLKPFVTTREAIGDLLPGVAEPGELVEGEFGELAAEVPAGQNYLWHTDRYGGRDVFKWRSRYWTFLLRLDPERPSTTLQAQPGPWVGPFHWENLPNETGQMRARRLRVVEMLRLMTFPADYQLVGNRADIQSQLGNAVPVELGKVVIRALAEQLGHLEASEVSAVGPEPTQLELIS